MEITIIVTVLSVILVSEISFRRHQHAIERIVKQLKATKTVRTEIQDYLVPKGKTKEGMMNELKRLCEGTPSDWTLGVAPKKKKKSKKSGNYTKAKLAERKAIAHVRREARNNGEA